MKLKIGKKYKLVLDDSDEVVEVKVVKKEGLIQAVVEKPDGEFYPLSSIDTSKEIKEI